MAVLSFTDKREHAASPASASRATATPTSPFPIISFLSRGTTPRSLAYQAAQGITYAEEWEENEVNDVDDPEKVPTRDELVVRLRMALREEVRRERVFPGWRDRFWDDMGEGKVRRWERRWEVWIVGREGEMVGEGGREEGEAEEESDEDEHEFDF